MERSCGSRRVCTCTSDLALCHRLCLLGADRGAWRCGKVSFKFRLAGSSQVGEGTEYCVLCGDNWYHIGLFGKVYQRENTAEEHFM